MRWVVLSCFFELLGDFMESSSADSLSVASNGDSRIERDAIAEVS